MENTNLVDFLDLILKNSLTDILDRCPDQSTRGFVYESCWSIVIKLGFCDKFPNSRFIHLEGNANNGTLKEITSILNYLIKDTYKTYQKITTKIHSISKGKIDLEYFLFL